MDFWGMADGCHVRFVQILHLQQLALHLLHDNGKKQSG